MCMCSDALSSACENKKKPAEDTDAFLGPALGDGPKPYKFIGFGDDYGPKPYKFIGFGNIYGPNPINS